MILKSLLFKLKALYQRDGLSRLIKNILSNYPTLILNRWRMNKAYAKYITNCYSKLELLQLDNIIDQSSYKPLISILMPTYKSNLQFLRLAVNSVLNQSYGNWELCIVDDASNDSNLTDYLTGLSNQDSRIKCHFSPINQHISKTSNLALEMCTGVFVTLLDHDDELSRHALAYLASEIIKNPNVKIIYSDEDKLNANGRRYDPYFKCNWNYELFLGQNLISHLGAYSTKLMREVGGFRPGYEGSQDYDLALRCVEKSLPGEIVHIPKVLYHWRVLPGSTALNINEKPYVIIAAERALSEHFERSGRKGYSKYIHYGYQIIQSGGIESSNITVFIKVSKGQLIKALRLAKNLADLHYIAKVILLIIQADYSIIDYGHDSNIEINIITDNEQLEDGSYSAHQIHRVLFDNNFHELPSKFVLLLSSDIETSDWSCLESLYLEAKQPNVAAVSAVGFNMKGELICGPKVVDSFGQDHNPFYGALEASGGYFGRQQLTQQLSSLDTDCLLMNMELIRNLQIDYLSIKSELYFFLILRENKLKLIWTPFSKIYFGKNNKFKKTRSKKIKIKNNLDEGITSTDEFYSPNFLPGNKCFIVNSKKTDPK